MHRRAFLVLAALAVTPALPALAEEQDDSPEAIFARAAERARKRNVPYAGDVTPREAHILQQAGLAEIVDVRTKVEHSFVGRVPGTKLVEWHGVGEKEGRPRFVEDLFAATHQDKPVLLLCRSGVRSVAAATAAAKAGYRHVYNVLEGFEGDKDKNNQRGTVGGWRHEGLPWVQD